MQQSNAAKQQNNAASGPSSNHTQGREVVLMAESLKGKVAVITGVGSGFGKATAELFASKDQANLVLIDFNEKALADTAECCRMAGSKVVAIPADVTKGETFEQALAAALENWGKVD